MNDTPQTPDLNPIILEEASEWFVTLREDEIDAVTRNRFTAWILQSPEHARAYLEVAAIWADARHIDRAGQIDVDTLIARARPDQNVVRIVEEPLTPGVAHDNRKTSPKASAPDSRRTPRHHRRFWLAIAATLVLATTGLSTWYYAHRGVYATGTGEQHSFTLQDGSTIELNAQTELRVRYTEHARTIELVRGQALFHVAKDSTRPFLVRSGDATVRAVGTQFDVYRKQHDTTVTVLEGKVTVGNAATAGSAFPADGVGPNDSAEPLRSSGSDEPSAGTGHGQGEVKGREILLIAGEQLIVTPQRIERPKRANVSAATAWTQRQLVFDGTPLSEVIAELNRYNTRQLVLDDDELASLRINGVFPTSDPHALLQFLRVQPELTVTETAREIHITAK